MVCGGCVSPRVAIERSKVGEFCRRWRIAELALFGSVLRDDFRPDSDVDVLVTFESDAHWSLFDHVSMQEELGVILGRRVDLVTRAAVERSSNWIRKKAILSSAESYYVAG
jgi:hypothetical protein